MRGFLKYILYNNWPGFILLGFVVLTGFWASPLSNSESCSFCNPVSVDALPEMGDNQQIVFAEWEDHSAQEIDEKVTNVLYSALSDIEGLDLVRSHSMDGHCSLYLIFESGFDFWKARENIELALKKMDGRQLPLGVEVEMGPPSTATGQVYWYTLQGRDPDGNPSGGWDPKAIWQIQEDIVGPFLAKDSMIAEVATVGGVEPHCMVQLSPSLMHAKGLDYTQVASAISKASLETHRANGLENCQDILQSKIGVQGEKSVFLSEIANSHEGPGHRHGILDYAGAEVIGGVVSVRKGANDRVVIAHLKSQIEQLNTELPYRLLSNGRKSQLQIIPFYDRSTFIDESLDTLSHALGLEVLITLLVILLLAFNFRESILISAMLPLAVLFCFFAMKVLAWEANIVALSGIAIAIGTMVDMAIVIQENIERHLKRFKKNDDFRALVLDATMEVAPAVLTSVATTIISFLPIFALQNAEGQLFHPLAFTKTFSLLGAVLLSICLLPILNVWVLTIQNRHDNPLRRFIPLAVVDLIFTIILFGTPYFWWGFLGLGIASAMAVFLPKLKMKIKQKWLLIPLIVLLIGLFGSLWMPLGLGVNPWLNIGFAALLVGLVIGTFWVFLKGYPYFLKWCLQNKKLFLVLPIMAICSGVLVWRGFEGSFSWAADTAQMAGLDLLETSFWQKAEKRHPGLSSEFMPSLDEGEILLMPTLPAQASVEEVSFALQRLDMTLTAIPEVELVVGKAGRARSALDPAPMNMLEVIVRLKPELSFNQKGQKERNWRPEIRNRKQIHATILQAAQFPGLSNSPILQPIETRLLMLQSGIQSRMAIKIAGQDATQLEAAADQLVTELRHFSGLNAKSIFREEILGVPEIQVNPDRDKMRRLGISTTQLGKALQATLFGMELTPVFVDGKETKLMLNRRGEAELSHRDLGKTMIPTMNGGQIPLAAFCNLVETAAPSMLKRENGELVTFVLFEKEEGEDDLSLVTELNSFLEEADTKERLKIGPEIALTVTGDFENEIRATSRLKWLIPLSIVLVFLILYLQFRSVSRALIVFSSVLVAFAGGFWMLWLTGQSWWLDFGLFDGQLRDALAIEPVNLSVAVWLGFIALLGIATEDGVVLGTYISQLLKANPPKNKAELHETILEAGLRRIRPCIMTIATTMLALIPVMTSSGLGADIMRPMAVPVFGGMAMALLTLFVVPVLYAVLEEAKLRRENREA